MFLEAEFRKRVNKLYGNLTARAKPKLWKSGKRRGTMRVPGLKSLGFFRDELWAHVTAQVPEGGAQCPYCKAIGRTTIIFLETFVLDHHIPVKWAQSDADLRRIWALQNLVCVCSDCNTIKNAMSYTAFVVLMRDFLPDLDPLDQKYVIACLRTHGQVLRSFGPKAKKPLELPAPAAPPQQRTLDDDF